MRDKDWETFFKFFIAIVVIAFVLWVLGAAIQFLTNQKFLFGILVGLVVGTGITFAIMRFIVYRNR